MSSPLERVELVEEEYVAARGTAVVRWFVRKNDGWVRAGTLPGARSERLESGAGIVWRTRVELELARDTRLLRVEARPDPRPQSTLSHLMRARPGKTARTLRAEYRVGVRGSLERTSP